MVQKKSEPAYLSKPQLADYLSVSPRTVNQFMKQGLPYYRAGSKILRYKRTEVDEWFSRFRADEDQVDRIVNEVLV
jgi:excisionase family DNA binding protein